MRRVSAPQACSHLPTVTHLVQSCWQAILVSVVLFLTSAALAMVLFLSSNSVTTYLEKAEPILF